MRTRTVFGVLACLLLALSLGLGSTACTTSGGGSGTGGTSNDGTGGGGEGTADQTGTLRVLITDKPFPLDCIKEAIITITRVEARQADAEDAGTNGDVGTSSDVGTNGDTSTNGNSGDAGTNGGDSGGRQVGENENAEEAGDDNDNDGDVDTNGDDGDNENDNDNGDDDAGTNGDDGDDDNENDDDGDENLVESEGDEDGGGGFLVISDLEQEFNLLDLQGGQTDLLAEAVLPVGTYTQLRLIVTEGRVKLIDDREPPVTVPSGEQTGIKLRLNFEVTSEETTVLLLDVDLSRAFTPIPGDVTDCTDDFSEFVFSPSLAMRLVELDEVGSIAGTVTDDEMQPIEDALVTAFAGEEEVTSTGTVQDGTYTLAGLPAGEYRLEFSAADFQDAELTGVTVETGETVEGTDVTMTADDG
jgi:hypothetical protein